MGDDLRAREARLARELQRLVGARGERTRRFEPVELQRLPQIQGALVSPDPSARDLTNVINEGLRQGIGQVSETITVYLTCGRPRRISADKAKAALRTLLALSPSASRLPASHRRDNVQFDLGFDDISSDAWRRSDFKTGPELQLMVALSEHLLKGAQPVRIDAMRVDCRVYFTKRIKTYTWHVTALAAGAHTISFACDSGDRVGKVEIVGPLDIRQKLTHPANDDLLQLVEIQLPELDAWQQIEVHVAVTSRLGHRNPKYVCLLAQELMPPEFGLGLRFGDDCPERHAWAFNNIQTAAEVEASRSQGLDMMPSPDGIIRHTFLEPKRWFGIAWDPVDPSDPRWAVTLVKRER